MVPEESEIDGTQDWSGVGKVHDSQGKCSASAADADDDDDFVVVEDGGYDGWWWWCCCCVCVVKCEMVIWY